MVTMTLPATATLTESVELLKALGADTDVVDAAALKEFDTSAVALLLEARRRSVRRGATLQVRNAPPKLVQLARLYGVEELLSLEST